MSTMLCASFGGSCCATQVRARATSLREKPSNDRRSGTRCFEGGRTTECRGFGCGGRIEIDVVPEEDDGAESGAAFVGVLYVDGLASRGFGSMCLPALCRDCRALHSARRRWRSSFCKRVYFPLQLLSSRAGCCDYTDSNVRSASGLHQSQFHITFSQRSSQGQDSKGR